MHYEFVGRSALIRLLVDDVELELVHDQVGDVLLEQHRRQPALLAHEKRVQRQQPQELKDLMLIAARPEDHG